MAQVSFLRTTEPSRQGSPIRANAKKYQWSRGGEVCSWGRLLLRATLSDLEPASLHSVIGYIPQVFIGVVTALKRVNLEFECDMLYTSDAVTHCVSGAHRLFSDRRTVSCWVRVR